MRVVRPSVLLIVLLVVILSAPTFNSETKAQGAIQFMSVSSHTAVLIFINQKAQDGIELENLQVVADYDGVIPRFTVFYRENPGQAVAPYINRRFNEFFIGRDEWETIEDAVGYVLTYLNYVDGDISEPHMPVRDAVLAVYGTDEKITFEIFHRQDDRGDPGMYEWDWFTRDGDRELSTLLMLLNGQFQENPRAFYPTDLLSLGVEELDEHIYFNFHQAGKTGPAASTPVGWGAQSFTNAQAVVNFLTQENPEEFRVAADYDDFTERFRVFWR